MRTKWTKEEMESVLIQLNNQLYPFEKYQFTRTENGLVLLGSGGYANVYEMEYTNNPKKKFAIKVLGFGNKRVDSAEFHMSVQIQKELSAFQRDVVRIIDFAELRVYVNRDYEVYNIEEISETDDKITQGNFLDLQFILMENLIPVIKMDKSGVPQLYPRALAEFDEKEILKLAHNIGTALARAHEKKLLHRDVKLENVFYDPEKKIYKLGDFGIAKMSKDGMASTVAFTKGYGAPEVVGNTGEKYDNTADIYSFGIMLFILLNELRFPNSKNYNVNMNLQYSKGYQLPQPDHAEHRLSYIIEKMCQYYPDDRYQSMENVLNDVEGIIIGDNLQYKKENRKSTYVAGIVSYVLGVSLWKMTHMPEFTVDIDSLGYIFLLLCLGRYSLILKKKEHGVLSFLVLCLGSFILISTGFTWWKLLLVMVMAMSSDIFGGLTSLGILIVDIFSQIILIYPEIYQYMQQYKWCAILFLSFSLICCLQYLVLKERDVNINTLYFKRNKYWIVVTLLYISIAIDGVLYKHSIIARNTLNFTIINYLHRLMDSYDTVLIGLTGSVLSICLIIREYVLSGIRKLKLKI